MTFSARMPGQNRAIERLTRKESLFLSAAAQNNHPLLMPAAVWLSSLRFAGNMFLPLSDALVTADLCSDTRLRNLVSRMVQQADLGVADMELRDVELTAAQRKLFAGMVSESGGTHPPSEPRLRRIRLLHRFGKDSIEFDPDMESAGTRAYLGILGPVLNSLVAGSVLCVDELESSLHPLLASQLVGLFNDKSSNSKGGQLIFNTHDATLLDHANLRRDQIWFTEKGNDGASHLYPLTDFKPRINENLRSGYLQGRYGAIPFLSSQNLLEKFERSNGKA
jgi:hypothetical protein